MFTLLLSIFDVFYRYDSSNKKCSLKLVNKVKNANFVHPEGCAQVLYVQK